MTGEVRSARLRSTSCSWVGPEAERIAPSSPGCDASACVGGEHASDAAGETREPERREVQCAADISPSRFVSEGGAGSTRGQGPGMNPEPCDPIDLMRPTLLPGQLLTSSALRATMVTTSCCTERKPSSAFAMTDEPPRHRETDLTRSEDRQQRLVTGEDTDLSLGGACDDHRGRAGPDLLVGRDDAHL